MMKSVPDSVQRLDDLFFWRCAEAPEALAYAFIKDDLTLSAQFTYEELLHKVGLLARGLQQRALPGSRVLLLFPPGLDVVLAFWACIVAGLVPVPAPSPDPLRLKNSLPRLRAILDDAAASLVLAAQSNERVIEEWSRCGSREPIEWTSLDRLEQRQQKEVTVQPGSLSLAYLQYTSGSTATPRGVMISHQNVLRQCNGLLHSMAIDSTSRSLCWLPHFHDYGLVHGIIGPFYAGIPAFLMSPVTFLRRPLRWLDALDRWAITHSGAPNFSYDACVTALRKSGQWSGNLDRWSVATCGAEPVHARTIEQFSDAFSPYGFKRRAFTPAYGLAESTLVVSSTPYEEEPLVVALSARKLEAGVVDTIDHHEGTRTLVGCGRPLPDTQVKIVNPATLVECRPDEVGEIWISGPSVGQGYWNRAEITNETFNATIAERTDAPYLRTGDLGFLHQEHVFIAGRLKDLIILNGRNLYPNDVELAVEGCHPALRSRGCAAFSVEEQDQERLVIVQEIDERKDLNADAAITAIRIALAEMFEVPAWAVVLVRSGSIPRTSSGKIQRQACRLAYLSQSLSPIASHVATAEPVATDPGSSRGLPISGGGLESELIRLIAEHTGMASAQIDPESPIVNFGLDSLKMTLIKNRLEQDYGLECSFARLFGGATIRSLAESIGPSSPTTENSSGGSAVQSSPLDERDVHDRDSTRLRVLSPSQRRLWFLEQMQPGSALNHISLAIRLKGPFDKHVFATSWNTIIRRHDLLRASFSSEGDDVRQSISSNPVVAIRYGSMANVPASSADEEIRRWVREEALVPFDLSKPPLLRVLTLERASDDHVLVITVHRLIADGWSLGVLTRELTALYNANGSSEMLPAPPAARYEDYAKWQEKWDSADVGQLAYWTRQLSHLPSTLELPTDRPRPRVRQFLGGAKSRMLGGDILQSLDNLGRKQGATKFMALYAAFAAWLQRCARTDDIVIGSVIANRRFPQWESVVGYLVNTVALRLNLAEVTTADDLVAQARQVVAEAYDHQDVPFERVIEAVKAHGDSTTTVPFNVMIVWEDDPLRNLDLLSLSASHVPIDDVTTEFDLTLLVINGAEGLNLVMLYNRALFDGATVDRMLRQFETFLRTMLEHPATPLAKLPLLDEQERKQVLVHWNQTTTKLPFSAPIPEVVEARIQGALDHTAVVCGEESLTYRELLAQAAIVAQKICNMTKGGNVRVGLFVERSTYALSGLFGILKAGAAYVPLDPSAPEARQRMILEDAGLNLVVTQRHLRSQVSFDDDKIIELEEVQELAKEPVSATSLHSLQNIKLDDLAYMVYTSGSTGRPKGVEVTHRALLNSLAARLHYYADPAERCLLTFPLAFDGSITGIFWTLLHAGTLVIPSEDSYRDPQQLVGLIARHQISHIVLIPSLYDLLLREAPPTSLESLRVVVAAGESLPLDVVHRHHERLPEATLYNEYGPTEAGVWATVYRTNGTEQGLRVPIGRPIANARVYILDPEMQPLPVGVVGELYIGGAGVARGYRNLSALTEDKFIENPFLPGTRMYKTGDLGLFRQDGNIEFVGREDAQVKIRGHRIELGEVETALRELPGIREAVAVVQDDSAKGPSLLAFVTSDRAPTLNSPHFQELLGRRIPSYMMPAAVVVLDDLPMLPNGKVDRTALRHRTIETALNGVASVRPRDPIEQSLIELWSEILGRKILNVQESFFALGGHSLLATQVVSRIRELFRIELPLRVLFDTPTIAGVAEQIRLVQRQSNSRPPLPPIVPVSRTAPLAVSYSQQRMWFIQQLAPEATAYNLLFVSRQKGPLKISVLRQVIELLSRRHEAFRTTFAMTGAGLVQRIAPWQTPHLAEIDLRRLPKEQREQEARRLAEEEGGRPFDLERGPLARISVAKLDHDDHILILNIHHIVGDQWSFGILGRDFAAYYNALSQDLPIPETSLPVQYADYAAWQRRCLTDEILKSQESYWTRNLADLPILYLPTDFPRPAMQTFRGAYCAIELPQRLIDAVKAFGSRYQVTSFMTLLACFQLLLSRYTGQADIAVGSPIANRTQMVMEQLIGTFVNTLVLRLDVSGNPSFVGLVERAKEAALGAFANQDYPFDRLVDTLQVERDPSMAPLVQVLFNMVNAPIGDIQLFGLKWEPFEVDPGSAQFDLSLTVELEVAKKVYLTFNTDLFRRETAERFLRHFVTLLQNLVAHPEARLSELPILEQPERVRLLEEWNRTAASYPHTQCFPELFETQARHTPDAIAVSMAEKSLTYRSLNQKANRLARLLHARGLAPGTVVGVCLERSIELVTALLAVMKAGGTYVPLDPEYPQDRIRFMVEDCRAPFIITTSSLSKRFSGLPCRAILLDREQDSMLHQADHDLPPQIAAEDLVYILYTSGSTGQPKGVEIRHRSLVNFLWSMKHEPGCASRDIVLSVTTPSFDIAGLELYLPLLVGARVELVSRAEAMDGKKLSARLSTVHPTIMQATPATWRLLLESGWMGSKSLTALCGGEALSPELAKQLVMRTKQLWNMYGPTETTIWSTVEPIDADTQEITIGRPIANTEIYILDAQLNPVPIGVAGEMYIGGDGLARGYHRRPDMTADRFVPHPFSSHPAARLYRTGDMARYRDDGNLVHLGRMDDQVKIRGFRIELGEIESVLNRHSKVKQAVVAARDDQHGLKQLAAYVIAGQDVPTAEELRSFLRSTLPDYMVPPFVVFLDQFPLTANKKVDRRALPPPDLTGHTDGSSHVRPRNAMELQLAVLWQQVLGVQDVGVHENFFDLGGHSLKAAQLFFQLELIFGKQLPLATLFQAPTIAQLADVLVQANWTPPWQSLVAIQPGGTATPLFLVSGVGGNVLVFAKLAKLMGTEQPVYGLQARGLDGKEAPFTSVPDMAAHYLAEMQRMQPKGPYLIAGVCTGGLVAYEIAQQLAARGDRATVFMLDTWHPDSYARYRSKWFGHMFMTGVVLEKIVTDLRGIIRRSPTEWWPDVTRKSKVLFSLFSQSMTEHIQDQDFQIQRLTQATFLAVAHYHVRQFTGPIVNIVASRRRVNDVIPDTRHRWAHLGNNDSCTLDIPAEDSGRLLVSPYVEELVGHLRHYLQPDPVRPEIDRGHQSGQPA